MKYTVLHLSHKMPIQTGIRRIIASPPASLLSGVVAFHDSPNLASPYSGEFAMEKRNYYEENDRT